MPRDDDWDDDDDRPRRRKKRDRYDDDDEDDDDDYDRPRRRRGAGGKSGGVTAVGVINIVLGSLVTLLSLCFLLGGLLFTGAAADVNQFGPQPGAGVFAAVGGVVILLGLGILLIGAGLIIAGVGVLNRRNWGRILTFVLAGLVAVSALLELYLLIQAFSIPPGMPGKASTILWMIVAIIVDIAYIVMAFVVLLNPRSAGEFN